MPAIVIAAADGSGTYAIWTLSIATVSRLPLPVETEKAARRSQAPGWFDSAAREALSTATVVVPQTPGSVHVVIVVNDVGAGPSPYCSDQVTERPWTLSITRSIEAACRIWPVELKLKLKAAPGSPKSDACRMPRARFVEAP